MIKKLFVFLAIFVPVLFSSLFVPSSVFAANNSSSSSSCRNFLGLTSWDCNVNYEKVNSETSLSNVIWKIVSNVANDIVVIAAYLVLGYVIYGGYQYIFSSGEPGKIASAKKTLTNGFIGLAIVLLAEIIVSAIRFALNADFTKSCVSSECVNPTEMVSSGIQWVIAICGIVAAVFVVYGGILYITSSGEPSKTQRAKQTIIYALIGLAIVALAEVITAFVTNMINDAKTDTGLIFPNNQSIVKEIHDENV